MQDVRKPAHDVDDADEGPARWEWPLMEASQAQPDSNALGYQPDWYHEQETTVVSDMTEEAPAQAPLTLEEIEAIRQAAWEDGFAEGREAGFAEGREAGRLQGLQEGHTEGLQQGHAEGLASGEAEIQAQIAIWQQQVERLGHPLAELDAQVEQQLVWLALRLAKTLIGHEAHTSPDLLLGSLKQALQALPCADEGVTLSLHPDDLQRVVTAFGGEEACQQRGWTLLADPVLTPGDLQVQSSTSSIDWRLEERIDNLLRQFMRQNLPPVLP